MFGARDRRFPAKSNSIATLQASLKCGTTAALPAGVEAQVASPRRSRPGRERFPLGSAAWTLRPSGVSAARWLRAPRNIGDNAAWTRPPTHFPPSAPARAARDTGGAANRRQMDEINELEIKLASGIDRMRRGRVPGGTPRSPRASQARQRGPPRQEPRRFGNRSRRRR